MKRPNYTLRLLPVAEEDLTEIITYIAVHNISAAEELMTRIERALTALLKHPHLGRIPGELDLAQRGYRFLTVDNYLLFYKIGQKIIFVHRIIHGARDYMGLI